MKAKNRINEVVFGLFYLLGFFFVSAFGVFMARSGIYGGSPFVVVGGSIVFGLGLSGCIVSWGIVRKGES